MGDHDQFTAGVNAYRSGEPRDPSKPQSWLMGYDIARTESEAQIYENDRQRRAGA